MAGNILISKISLTLCTKFETLVAPSKLFSKLLKFCIMFFITLINKMTDEEVKNLKFDFSWITLMYKATNRPSAVVHGKYANRPPWGTKHLYRAIDLPTLYTKWHCSKNKSCTTWHTVLGHFSPNPHGKKKFVKSVTLLFKTKVKSI